jgi:glycolate oxidase FAD binding subunit
MQAPADEAEMVEWVGRALAAERPIFIAGGGTKAAWGPRAPTESRDAVRLCTRGLASVVAYEPADMVVTVQAGMTLLAVQEALAPHGQWLPLDPPFAGATIGGILATASSGPRRHGYGAPRDFLLGMKVLGATGVPTKSGGRVVKNVAGFDLHRLHTGAFGSLGMILEASFKVAARPAAAAVVVRGAADLTAALGLLGDVWSSPLKPVALTAVEGAQVQALRAAIAAPLPGGHVLAFMGIEGAPSSVERHLRDLAGRGGDEVVHDTEAVWAAFRDLAPPGDVVVRVGLRPRLLPEFLVSCAPRVGALVHAGLGVARVSLAGAATAVADTVKTWHQRAAALGGYAVVESALVDLPERDRLPFFVDGSPKAPFDAAAVAGGHALLSSVKRAWDPKQLWNPGRVPL